MSAGMFMQGEAGPVEEPGFYSVSSGGSFRRDQEHSSVFKRSLWELGGEACGTQAGVRKLTGQLQAQESALVKAQGKGKDPKLFRT